MKLNKNNKGFTRLSQKDSGFTIIEVLIVLVIAGLIMLIVFLAVPALQRNSRNTQRRADASALSTAAREFRTNTKAWPATAADIVGLAKLGIYAQADVIVSDAAGSANTVALTPNLDNWNDGGFTPLSLVYVLQSVTCGNNGTTIANRNGEVTVIYGLEQSTGPRIARCV